MLRSTSARSSAKAPAVALAVLGALAVGRAFIPWTAQTASAPAVRRSSSASSGAAHETRRRFLLATGAVLTSPAVQGGISPVFAAASKRAPETLEVIGCESRDELNGRWSIVLGNFINTRAVYKRDGFNFFLMYNDCNQFQMSNTVTGECKGWGINNKGVWTVDGKPNADMKVKPAGSAPPVVPARKQLDVNQLLAQEAEKLEKEANVNTFLGNLDEKDDGAAQRLMNKFGAKLAPGM